MHTQLKFENLDESQKEILIAKLYEYCEGFEESDTGLKAVINNEIFDSDLQQLLNDLQPKPLIEKIPTQNWNQLWESNFDPVVVDDFVAIKADFHHQQFDTKHEIIITPKMSFGTGHHATTFLMMQMMREIDFKSKSVFDFGTGTGILAILASILGASKIVATDIDEWSIENAMENFKRNQIQDFTPQLSGSAVQEEQFDVILANINKNVLLESIPHLSKNIIENGILLMSGLLEADEGEITRLCTQNSLKLYKKSSKSGWICLYMNKL